MASNAPSEAAGGSEDSTQAHSESTEVNKLDKFIRRGEEILQTFASSIRAFEGQTLEIRNLKSTVAAMNTGIKRKERDQPITQSISKKSKTDTPTSASNPAIVVSGDERESDNETDVDTMMSGVDPNTQSTDQPAQFMDMDDFFEEESNVSDPVLPQVATMINKNLRKTKIDKQKMKALTDNYKRPANIDCLQVPKVDRFLWRQLSNNLKTVDVAKQQMIDALNKTAGPLITAMNHCCNNPSPDPNLLKQTIGDTFKFLCSSICKTNNERREAIKKELDSTFKSVCTTDMPISATGLFGDNLPEKSKELEIPKIKMTSKVPFLGSGRGSSLPHTVTSNYGYQTNFNHQQSYPSQNRRPNQQNTNKSGHQPWGKKNFSQKYVPSGKTYPKKDHSIQKRK